MHPRLLVVLTLVVGLVAAMGIPVFALPSSGDYPAQIDDYASWEDQGGECTDTEQPGTQDFRALLQEEYGANGGGITRACSGGTSEHDQGRAYDWMLDADDPADREKADEVLDWLLATDQHGNAHAMARRFGLMYIIWNEQVWKAYQPDEGWQPYTGYSPHTDHIHFSFSWDGAKQRTTYWTLGGSTAGEPTPTATGLEGDFDGDGRTDVVRFDPRSGDWNVGISTGDRMDVSRWSNFRTRTGWQSHEVGDFDGDGLDDVMSYHTDTGRWWLNRSTGDTFVLQRWHTFRTNGGWTHHLAGNFDGDGTTDMASHHGATGRWWISTSTGSGFVSTLGATSHADGAWQDHLVADVDGRGTDELVSFDTGNGDWVVHRMTRDGLSGATWGNFRTRTGWDEHLVGDFTGDGADDVASYHPGAGTWWVSTTTSPGTLDHAHWESWKTRTGWSTHLVGDVHGDGRDDIVSYHPGAGSLWVSTSNSRGFDGSRWDVLDTDVDWTPLLLGTFTGDDAADVAGFDPAASRWWVGAANGNSFETSAW